jgi:hypothetical protein
MEEYGDIYYVDDARNATRDHRAQGGTVSAGSRPGFAPGRPTRTLVVQPPASAGGYRPAPYGPQGQVVYTPAPVMYPEPVIATAGSLLGRLTIAQLIEIAAQVFAALQTLPPPPTPQRDTETNVANLILYQTALAQHAKRDEQVRTLGSLVSRLAG